MKQLFITCLFLLFFSGLGCDNSEENITHSEDDKSKIHFGDKIVTTKALIDDTTLPLKAQVGIFSWGHKSNGSSTNTNLRKDLNNNLYIKSTDSELTSDIHAHYPINPDTLLNFYAYYPYTAAATAAPLAIPFDLKKQDDIMWATPVLNRDKTTADKPVDLSFNHLLSAITLKFKKADDIKEEMILQSIAMKNYSSTIQLNVQDGKLTAPSSTSAYTLIDNLKTEITPTEITVVTNYLLYPVENPTFIVRMSDKDYEIKSSKAFEGGKKQTYSFTIQAKDIVISGSINPWQDGGTSNETVYF